MSDCTAEVNFIWCLILLPMTVHRSRINWNFFYRNSSWKAISLSLFYLLNLNWTLILPPLKHELVGSEPVHRDVDAGDNRFVNVKWLFCLIDWFLYMCTFAQIAFVHWPKTVFRKTNCRVKWSFFPLYRVFLFYYYYHNLLLHFEYLFWSLTLSELFFFFFLHEVLFQEYAVCGYACGYICV